jgi:hypothetical protein
VTEDGVDISRERQVQTAGVREKSRKRLLASREGDASNRKGVLVEKGWVAVTAFPENGF